jgi:hypothetical protein
MFAKSLSKLRPGRNLTAVHEVMQRALLTGVLTSEEPMPSISRSSLERALENSRSSNLIDDALQTASRAHAEALQNAGISGSAFELLQSWVEVMVDARVMQRQLELQRALGSLHEEMQVQQASVLKEDPVQALSAAELGKALGVSDERVRQRERAGELFSILRPGRKRGREYPAFQSWPGVEGEPQTRVLRALRPASNAAVYGFFSSPMARLGGLTPIEIMVGRMTSARAVDPAARELLDAPPDERLEVVLKAAESYIAILEA